MYFCLNSDKYYARWTYIFDSGVICCEYLGSFLLMLMATERYILICLPHQSDQWLSNTRRKYVIFCTLIAFCALMVMVVGDAYANSEIVGS